ncbi:type I-E CRISPR-associated endoribonuclease Cas2e [Myceligenerans pegani]|uniref:Type I-E CRISPR-associated endoribonuclease Cas2 n=1 Tax=Myceligenerans pegani TaxID=2776917 RepID=A0ABR9N2S0_9MICO|nr:type I-E CRISPR-associated endoribonuclease Cas2e [Myceligenerans sp. TRM 65318]MBE1877449.1 type I-E CRISPR-associated endoribonuclease Cas2 [Myceligenerans sp. TRM 65318]MBE3019720.1 type I-E CRISPR-associated endoribonuclease Cas2 [Myceligenerans sp. TRM 65318]
MIVVVVTACPQRLRGDLTRWLLEISAGVFVGHSSARVRDMLWERIIEHVRQGKALMVHSTRGEQRLAFRVHNHDWEPTDIDGLTLMRRPSKRGAMTRMTWEKDGEEHEDDSKRVPKRAPENWSIAARRRRFRNEVERRHAEQSEGETGEPSL